MRARPLPTSIQGVPVPWGVSQNDLEAVEDILSATSLASNLHGVLSTRRNRRAVPDHESCRRICPTAGTSGRTKTTSSTAKQPLAQPRAVASKARLCPSTSTPTRGAAPPVPGWERALSSGRTMRPPPDAFEEFVLDDSDLLRLCEPPGPHRPRRSAAPGGGASAGRRPPHLRTVSIIDTLSALARGAQDHREDVAAAEPWLPASASRRPPRRPAQAVPRDWSRQYASDSELKSGGDACSVLSLRSQQPRRPAQRPPLARVPHWIRAIFRVAKKGDLDALSHSLRDMEKQLVWNLSDSQGNTLWHVCAARNHLRCFQWLCQGHPERVLADENHSNLTPVATAVKHGNLEILQWLVSKSMALDQIDPSEGNRTLLHLAAKYGQEKTVSWLAEYMQNNQLDINRKDSDGNTAMHLAARYGHIPVIKTLVLHSADVTVQNEQGLRPYGVALQNSQASCADYLLTVEVCLGLSADQVLLEGHFHSLQAENTEVKNGFKELLVLTRRLMRRQEEALQYVQAVCTGSLSSDRAESDSASSLPWNSLSGSPDSKQAQAKLQALLENSQLKLLPEEESRLLQLEEKWRRLRVNKGAVETRSPMELIRSQFAQVLAKCSTPQVQPMRPASSSGTSVSHESEEESAEDEPNVINSVATTKRVPNLMPWEQEVCSWDKVQVFLDGLCEKQAPPKKNRSSNTLVIRQGASRMRAKDYREQLESAPENVSLKVLFENNPELRQEGQTCSVLEVLEPSSSDAEDDLHHDSCGSSSGSFRSNENAVLHVAQRRQPNQANGDCRVRASSSGASKEGGRARAIFLTNIAELPDCSSGYKLSVKFQQSQECSHTNLPEVAPKEEVLETNANDSKTKIAEKQASLAEPDLIRGTSVAERCPLDTPQGSAVSSMEAAAREVPVQEIEEQREQHDGAEAVAAESTSSPADVSSTSASSAKKRSGFLLKFSLKSRFQSKQKQQQQQQQQQRKCEEISPEEFRETYTRNAGSESMSVPSRDSAVPSPVKGNELFSSAPLPPPPIPTQPRRGPPPVPPSCEEVPPRAPTPLAEGQEDKCTPSEDGLLYLRNGSPEPSILQPDSVVSKTTEGTLSRPASSASQTEDGRRGSVALGRTSAFSLAKPLSPTELLLHTPDSSVGGRQSPAPSEVSKTESALSPPSEASKAESARQPPLTKIDEAAQEALKRVAVPPPDVTKGPQETATAQDSQPPLVSSSSSSSSGGVKAKKMTLAARKNKRSSKPWYEVSDEEDMLLPDKYQTVRTRSSSEDEADLAIVA
ncbi:uncharacterized protein LOC119172904 isoform X1 [Rhipicephalus microplus]|uniref:uncharacterized protein LOC119172904 isoform X1 n=2 Tax=Rhipicephalus microplus TaxID=6941 RepID=UPI003F6CDD70